jgi:quercetin dioxygenase-like cupin family protein
MESHTNFLEFTEQAKHDGFDEIVQKEWAPNLVVGKHTHPVDVRVQVAAGLVKLEVENDAQIYEAGQSFYIARGTEHAEYYGADGATFWVARKL